MHVGRDRRPARAVEGFQEGALGGIDGPGLRPQRDRVRRSAPVPRLMQEEVFLGLKGKKRNKLSPEEIAYARQIMEAWNEAEAAGRGSLAMDGRMVDVPVVKRAQNLLAFADAIEARSR